MGFYQTILPTVNPIRRIAPMGRASLRDGGWTAADILAEKIICIARTWIGVTELPAGSNKGGRLDDMHKRYDPNWKGDGRAYCAIWVWDVMQEAATWSGGTNMFPGYAKTLGNARKTLDMSYQATLPVDYTPVAGSAFFRNSDDPKASGHMGIVESWDGTTLVTIEGNQGNSHSVQRYRYAAAEVLNGKNGWIFIHTERMPHSVKDGDDRWKALLALCRKNRQIINTAPPIIATVPIVPTSPATSFGGGGSSIEVKKSCLDQFIGDNSPHFSVLQKQEIASDITGGKAVSIAARNGTAIGMPNGSSNPDHHSAIGWFVDRNGNTIIVTHSGSKQWGIVREKKLAGDDPLVVRVERFTGDGSAERNADIISGRTTAPGARSERIANVGGRDIRYDNIYHLLEQVEGMQRKLDRPLVVELHADIVTIGSILNQVVDILINTIASFGPAVGIPSEKIKAVLNVVKKLASGEPITWSNAMEMLKPIADLITPASLQPYVDKGATSYAKVLQGDWKGAAAAVGINLEAVQKDAGLWLNDVYQSTGTKEFVTSLEKLYDAGKAQFKDVSSSVQTFVTANVVNQVRWTVQNIDLKLAQTSGGQLLGIPAVGELFAGGLAGSLLPTVPKVEDMMAIAINKASDVAAKENPHLWRALALTGAGFPAPSGQFRPLTYKALQQRAAQALSAGLKKITLGAGIPDSEALCFAELLRNDFDIRVEFSASSSIGTTSEVRRSATTTVATNTTTSTSVPVTVQFPSVQTPVVVAQQPMGPPVVMPVKPTVPVVQAPTVYPPVVVQQPTVPPVVMQPVKPTVPVVQAPTVYPPVVVQQPVQQPTVPPVVMQPVKPTVPVVQAPTVYPPVAVQQPVQQPTVPPVVMQPVQPAVYPPVVVQQPVQQPTVPPVVMQPVQPPEPPTPHRRKVREWGCCEPEPDCGCGCGGTCGCDDGLQDNGHYHHRDHGRRVRAWGNA